MRFLILVVKSAWPLDANSISVGGLAWPFIRPNSIFVEGYLTTPGQQAKTRISLLKPLV